MIYRFFYGMVDGKVTYYRSPGLTNVLSDLNAQRLRFLTPEDSDKYLWLPTEQLVAFPHVTMVKDDDGRRFVQNQTVLVPIHDYLRLTNVEDTLAKHILSVDELFQHV